MQLVEHNREIRQKKFEEQKYEKQIWIIKIIKKKMWQSLKKDNIRKKQRNSENLLLIINISFLDCILTNFHLQNVLFSCKNNRRRLTQSGRPENDPKPPEAPGACTSSPPYLQLMQYPSFTLTSSQIYPAYRCEAEKEKLFMDSFFVAQQLALNLIISTLSPFFSK